MTRTTWRLAVIGAALAAAVGFFVSCGASDDKDDENTQTGTTLTFAADVNPILKKSCSGSDCHSTGSTATVVYIDAETAFNGDKSDVKTRINLTSGSVMPPTTSSLTLSAADKTILLNYIAQ